MPIKVLTDHKNLEYFITTKKLTPRQARWAEFLFEYNFLISYQSGKKNNKADALTRKPNKPFAGKDDERLEYCMQTWLPPKCFEHAVNLQPMEVEHKNSLNAKTPNEDIISAVDLAEPHVMPHAESSAFSNKVKEAN